MKNTMVWVKWVLVLLLVSGSLHVSAASSKGAPRGKAYGYYLKDGGYVLFTYQVDDGTRWIELSRCHPNKTYLLKVSSDLVNWTTLSSLRPSTDGTATFHDTTPMSHCFYVVERAN